MRLSVIGSGISGIALAAMVSYAISTVKIKAIEARHENDMRTQYAAMKKSCDDEKAITKKVSHEYQKKVSDLNARLSDARKLYSRSCVALVAPDSPGGYDAATSSREFAGQAVTEIRKLPADFVIDLVGEGEKYRLQLLACQDFVRQVESLSK